MIYSNKEFLLILIPTINTISRYLRCNKTGKKDDREHKHLVSPLIAPLAARHYAKYSLYRIGTWFSVPAYLIWVNNIYRRVTE